ncbi:MAG: hypothetical protein RLZZ292_3694 [Bacteroidota bacterium]
MGCFCSIASLLLGQKKLEYGLSLGLGLGLDAEYYSTPSRKINSTTTVSHSVNSSIDDTPLLLAGISIAEPFTKKNGRWRTGVEVHTFQNNIRTRIILFNSTKLLLSNTQLQNTAIQIPLGYCKRWGHFMMYLGSGVTFLRIKDLTTEKEKADFLPEHPIFVQTVLDNFRKVYPMYDLGASWQWERFSIELNSRGAIKWLKQTDGLFDYSTGNRNFLYFGTKIYL